jgi:transcriptional regulator with XRE-family HTH domain
MRQDTKSTPLTEFAEKSMSSFGDRLRVARERKYDSAEQFAYHLGMRPHAYRKYERGQSWPGLATLKRICGMLEITPNDLIWDEAARRPKRPRSAGKLSTAA